MSVLEIESRSSESVDSTLKYHHHSNSLSILFLIDTEVPIRLSVLIFTFIGENCVSVERSIVLTTSRFVVI